MDTNHFKDLTESLQSSIASGSNLKEDDVFEPIIHQISSNSCSILRMRTVACSKSLLEPYLSERINYFVGIEQILKMLYSDYSKINSSERLKLFYNHSISPKTGKEKFEVMQMIKGISQKLRISWLEKIKDQGST